MTDLPRVAIALLTCYRTEVALETVISVCENLQYPNLGWYVAVDGANYDHSGWITSTLEKQKQTIIGTHCEDFVPGKPHAGASWNFAQKAAMEWADVVLWLEDDWRLPIKLDIHPYVQLLLERQDVGMMRLGGMAVGNDLFSVGHAGIHYLEYKPSTSFMYCGNPSLKHKRFIEMYGDFAVDRNPGEMEMHMDDKVRAKPDLKIWWPMDLKGWGIFQHIGTLKTFE